MSTRKFQVFHPDFRGDDDPWECFAFDHEMAAEKYGEWSDSQGDYCLARGSAYQIKVICDHGIERNFNLTAYTNVNYQAREIKSD